MLVLITFWCTVLIIFQTNIHDNCFVGNTIFKHVLSLLHFWYGYLGYHLVNFRILQSNLNSLHHYNKFSVIEFITTACSQFILVLYKLFLVHAIEGAFSKLCCYLFWHLLMKLMMEDLNKVLDKVLLAMVRFTGVVIAYSLVLVSLSEYYRMCTEHYNMLGAFVGCLALKLLLGRPTHHGHASSGACSGHGCSILPNT